MVLFNADGQLCGYYREVPVQRRPWGFYAFLFVVAVMMLGMFASVMVADLKKRGKEHVAVDALFRDAVRVDCPADPAYANASECIRTRRGVGFFFVDDNGVPRVVPVGGVGRIE